jgi:hypothetical protein
MTRLACVLLGNFIVWILALINRSNWCLSWLSPVSISNAKIMYYCAAEAGSGLIECDGLQGVLKLVRWDCVVSTASCYGLDGTQIESRWAQDFLHQSGLVLGPTLPPVQCVLGLFSGGKVVGVWHWPPTPSSTKVKERTELYLLHRWTFVTCSIVNLYLYLESSYHTLY